MSKFDFSADQKGKMIIWRAKHFATSEKGFQNGKDYEHIVPRWLWKETLWSKDMSDKLTKYITESDIKPHTGTHNLVSSWIVAANLYFHIRHDENLKRLMLEFLQKHISADITEIVEVNLEFGFHKTHKLSPTILLGELGGSNGSGQTSPDVAFQVKTKKGNGIILTECKYTEHSFYACSARKIDAAKDRENNPNPNRCMQPANSCNYRDICHQTVWGRKYLDLITLSEHSKNTLKRCPAATAGYQLLRQQALAEGIAQSGEYDYAVSAVAFDVRNTDLISCLRTTGIDNFQTGWATLFDGKAVFKTWTHQEWVQFVRDNQKNGEFDAWLNYMNQRYGY